MEGLDGGLAELGLQSLQALDAAQPVQHLGHASWRAADRAIDPLARQQDRALHAGRRRQLLQLIAQFLQLIQRREAIEGSHLQGLWLGGICWLGPQLP